MRSSLFLGLCLVGASAAMLPAQRGPAARGQQIDSGQSCPAGMTEIRPRRCAAPEFSPPSIVDYRPQSTLIVPAHRVKRAKFGAIDYHGHPQGLLSSPAGLATLLAAMDSLNLRMMVAADNMSGDRLRSALALINSTPAAKGRIKILTGISFRDVGPGWAERAVKQLDDDIAAGAVGVGEIGKGLGLSARKADGSRLRIDDPDLDPIWDECARLKIPVFIHTADPAEFFEPIDYTNERWLELALFSDRRYPSDRFPSFKELITERDNLFRKHPKTTFITAHMGWQANDLATLGKLLTELPNVYTEVGAVLYDIGRQPRVAREFFLKYQDRLLFGKDSFQPEEYPYYWRVFETADDYFDYYRDYHAFWKLYGIDLPDTVLKKLYYENAMRITPGLK